MFMRRESGGAIDERLRWLPAAAAESPTMLADGSTRKVAVEFWPTAYRFERRHRIRVIVGSGAHPRYVRNLGTGEPLGEGQRMITQRQEIMHGPEYASAISLSVVG